MLDTVRLRRRPPCGLPPRRVGVGRSPSQAPCAWWRRGVAGMGCRYCRPCPRPRRSTAAPGVAVQADCGVLAAGEPVAGPLPPVVSSEDCDDAPTAYRTAVHSGYRSRGQHPIIVSW